MSIRRRRPWEDIPPSQITSETAWLRRRELMGSVGSLAAGGGMMLATGAALAGDPCATDQAKALKYKAATAASEALGYYTAERRTPCRHVTGYNNFYEFGTGKSDPSRYAADFQPQSWSLRIGGEVGRPGDYDLEDILAAHPLEERIYRLRCVEAWSMVIPWIGFPLADLLRRFEPGPKARYVAFKTLHDPARMPGQRAIFGSLDWPYVEGLRIDEAMHPLSFLAVGLYGRVLPGQNGAPLRLVVPWKYGFKSIKSIVEIRLVQNRPPTSWNLTAPREYGFYSNVNPTVNHPRWSQREERRLPGSLLRPNVVPTRIFNGYGDQVAQLYKGMNLRRYY